MEQARYVGYIFSVCFGLREIMSEQGRESEKDRKEKERERALEKSKKHPGLVVGAKGRSSQGDENFEIKR